MDENCTTGPITPIAEMGSNSNKILRDPTNELMGVMAKNSGLDVSKAKKTETKGVERQLLGRRGQRKEDKNEKRDENERKREK